MKGGDDKVNIAQAKALWVNTCKGINPRIQIDGLSGRQIWKRKH